MVNNHGSALTLMPEGTGKCIYSTRASVVKIKATYVIDNTALV